jgi:hypothetical protein
MIVDRSLNLARSLFPTIYDGKKKYRTFHFSFAWKSNRLLSIGQNDPENTNAKAMWFARKFRNRQQVRYPYLHAEVDMLSKLWGRYYIDSRMKVVVVRINSNGELKNSKPCPSCSNILEALGVDKVWHSNSQGNIIRLVKE